MRLLVCRRHIPERRNVSTQDHMSEVRAFRSTRHPTRNYDRAYTVSPCLPCREVTQWLFAPPNHPKDEHQKLSLFPPHQMQTSKRAILMLLRGRPTSTCHFRLTANSSIDWTGIWTAFLYSLHCSLRLSPLSSSSPIKIYKSILRIPPMTCYNR